MPITKHRSKEKQMLFLNSLTQELKAIKIVFLYQMYAEIVADF
jgi:hypothetical protein